MKQIHIVPLSRQPLTIFHELHEKSGDGRFVFPGNRAGNDGPIYRGGPLRVLHQIGCATGEHTFYGFRSMAPTPLNELGYNADWIERQLAHCERSGVRTAYNYAGYLPERRRMVQEYADYLDGPRFTSDSAGAEKQADKTEDIFREMDNQCRHRISASRFVCKKSTVCVRGQTGKPEVVQNRPEKSPGLLFRSQSAVFCCLLTGRAVPCPCSHSLCGQNASSPKGNFSRRRREKALYSVAALGGE